MTVEPFETNLIVGVLHRPESPTGEGIVLAHGAGANHTAPLLIKIAEAFAGAGVLALRYDLPFRRDRPHGPPVPARAAHDREGIRSAIDALRALVPGRVYAGGHSYGGRQTAMLAAEEPALADALLLLAYPLHPPDRPAQLRTAFFPELRTPTLFVQGTSDPFATPLELRTHIAAIPARVDSMIVEGAGHDLKRAPRCAREIVARLRALV